MSARQDMTTGEARPIVIGTLPAVGYYRAGAEFWSDFRTAHFWLGASVPDAAPPVADPYRAAWLAGFEAAREGAAEVCHQHAKRAATLHAASPDHARKAWRWDHVRDEAWHIAAAIRAMEPPKQETPA